MTEAIESLCITTLIGYWRRSMIIYSCGKEGGDEGQREGEGEGEIERTFTSPSFFSFSFSY